MWFKTPRNVYKWKTLSVFEDLKEKSPNTAEMASFGASHGWCNGFKCFYNLQSLQLLSKVVKIDEKAFPVVTQKLFEEGGCTLDLIFNFDETSIINACLERPPSQRQENMPQDIRLLNKDC